MEGLDCQTEDLVLFFFSVGSGDTWKVLHRGMVWSESCTRKMNLLGCARRGLRLKVNLEG